MCSICHEAIKKSDVVETTCKHLFHGNCLEQWAAKAKENYIKNMSAQEDIDNQGQIPPDWVFPCPLCRAGNVSERMLEAQRQNEKIQDRVAAFGVIVFCIVFSACAWQETKLQNAVMIVCCVCSILVSVLCSLDMMRRSIPVILNQDQNRNNIEQSTSFVEVDYKSCPAYAISASVLLALTWCVAILLRPYFDSIFRLGSLLSKYIFDSLSQDSPLWHNHSNVEGVSLLQLSVRPEQQISQISRPREQEAAQRSFRPVAYSSASACLSFVMYTYSKPCDPHVFYIAPLLMASIFISHVLYIALPPTPMPTLSNLISRAVNSIPTFSRRTAHAIILGCNAILIISLYFANIFSNFGHLFWFIPTILFIGYDCFNSFLIRQCFNSFPIGQDSGNKIIKDNNISNDKVADKLGRVEKIFEKYPRECVICHENMKLFDNICVTECNHTFHEDCLKRWLQAHYPDSNSCPLCRFGNPMPEFTKSLIESNFSQRTKDFMLPLFIIVLMGLTAFTIQILALSQTNYMPNFPMSQYISKTDFDANIFYIGAGYLSLVFFGSYLHYWLFRWPANLSVRTNEDSGDSDYFTTSAQNDLLLNNQTQENHDHDENEEGEDYQQEPESLAGTAFVQKPEQEIRSQVKVASLLPKQILSKNFVCALVFSFIAMFSGHVSFIIFGSYLHYWLFRWPANLSVTNNEDSADSDYFTTSAPSDLLSNNHTQENDDQGQNQESENYQEGQESLAGTAFVQKPEEEQKESQVKECTFYQKAMVGSFPVSVYMATFLPKQVLTKNFVYALVFYFIAMFSVGVYFDNVETSALNSQSMNSKKFETFESTSLLQKDHIIDVASSSSSEDMSKDFCSICHEVFDSQNQISNCRHCNKEFHTTCLHTWIKQHDRCPWCQGSYPLPPKEVLGVPLPRMPKIRLPQIYSDMLFNMLDILQVWFFFGIAGHFFFTLTPALIQDQFHFRDFIPTMETMVICGCGGT